jgi:hypothetical protein
MCHTVNVVLLTGEPRGELLEERSRQRPIQLHFADMPAGESAPFSHIWHLYSQLAIEKILLVQPFSSTYVLEKHDLLSVSLP